MARVVAIDSSNGMGATSPLRTARRKRLTLAAEALVLARRAYSLALAVCVQFEVAEIVESRCFAVAEDLDEFLGHAALAHRAVENARDRTVGEFQLQDDIVVGSKARITGYSLGVDTDRRGLGNELGQVDEVADFSEDSSTALLWVMDPMVGGYEAGIDAVRNHEGVRTAVEVVTDFLHQWSEPPVESDHDLAVVGIAGLDESLDFVFGKSQGFLGEYVLARFQSLHGEPGVLIVTRQDEHRVYVLVSNDLFGARTEDPEAVFFAQKASGHAGGRRDGDVVGKTGCFKTRKKDRARKTAGTDQSHADALGGEGAPVDLDRGLGSAVFALLHGIVENDS